MATATSSTSTCWWWAPGWSSAPPLPAGRVPLGVLRHLRGPRRHRRHLGPVPLPRHPLRLDMFTLGYSFRPWDQDMAIADGPSILGYIRETAAVEGIGRAHPLPPPHRAGRVVDRRGPLARHRRAHRPCDRRRRRGARPSRPCGSPAASCSRAAATTATTGATCPTSPAPSASAAPSSTPSSGPTTSTTPASRWWSSAAGRRR